MENTIRRGLSAVLIFILILGCVPVFAAQSKTVWSVDFYDLSDPNGLYYRLEDGYMAWVAVTGHKHQLEVSSSGAVSFKSNKPSVASVTSSGVVTAKNAGIAKITITDKSDKRSQVVTIRVLKNHHKYKDGGDWDDEVYGVYSIAKQVYLKGSNLYVDMYIMNASNHSIGNLGQQSVYLATPWSDDYGLSDYRYVGTWSGKMGSLKNGKSRFVTINLGRVSPTTIYLRNADAYCQGGIVRGHLFWHGDEW